jgi:hypothetical protein
MISCKIEVLPLVDDCCLPPLLPAAAAAAATTAPVSVVGSFTTPPLPPPAIRLSFVSEAPVDQDGGRGHRRRRRQKGAPCVRRGRRQWRCEGVDNNDCRHADFADKELADDAGDVAAASVARDLARGAAITEGGEEGGIGGGGGLVCWRLHPPVDVSLPHNWLCYHHRQCADVVAADAHASLPSSRLRLSPSVIVALVARSRAGVVVIVVVAIIVDNSKAPAHR